MTRVMDEITDYASHYLVLLVMLTVGLAAWLYFAHNVTIQMAVGSLSIGAYWVWGVLHHHLKKDLNQTIMLEYTLIALFGLLVLWSVTAPA